MSDYGWRIATSMDDLEVGQVIASYSTMEGAEELVRAGRIVGFTESNAEVDNEAGETKRIGFHKKNVVFILADPPVDPAEEAWAEWRDHGAPSYMVQLASQSRCAFLAGWKAKEES